MLNSIFQVSLCRKFWIPRKETESNIIFSNFNPLIYCLNTSVALCLTPPSWRDAKMCAAPRTAKRPSEFVIDRSQLVSRGGGRIVHGDGQLVVPFSTIISIRKEASKSIEQGMHEKSLASFNSHELSLMQLCDDECSETPDKLSLRLCIDSFFPHEAKNDFNMDSVHRLRFQKNNTYYI